MKFTINIGLLNNPKDFTELYAYLSNWNGYTLLKFKSDSGNYHECLEPTFVGELTTEYKRLSKVIKDIENLCSVLNQECIAISSDQFDLLVYDISYTGSKDKFDSEYFLTI